MRYGLQHFFRWFVGLNLDDPVWDATVFSKNRDRLLEAEVAKEFLARVVGQAREKGWTSDEPSPWTARCWKRGTVGKVFSLRTRRVRHRRTIREIPR